MSDGRAFTDYRPRCAVNAELMTLVRDGKMVQSSYESRMYLQHQAEKVMDLERQKAMERMAPCAPCTRPFSELGTEAPPAFVVRCDGVTCSRTPADPNGVGDARQY